MTVFFSAPQKVNLGCSVNRCSSSPTLLTGSFDKNDEIKYVAQKLKTYLIILKIFIFDKTNHMVLNNSALVYPKVPFFKVCWGYEAKAL